MGILNWLRKDNKVRSTRSDEWFRKYWDWANTVTLPRSFQWHHDRQLLMSDKGALSFGLLDLCFPIWQVDRAPKPRADTRWHSLFQRYAELVDPPIPEEVDSLLSDIIKSGIIADFPDFDLTYMIQALALARTSRFTEAEAILEDALSRCPVKSALCKAVGDTKLWQNEVVSYGWYMQACLLGYDSYLPYLQLSYTSATIGKHDISIRLLNASDCLCGSKMFRLSPKSAQKTENVARKETDNMRKAFDIFLEFADFFLPPTDLLPKPNDEQRQVAMSILQINPEGMPTPKMRIVDRSFVDTNGKP